MRCYTSTVVHPTLWDASRSRNGSFIPMLELLFFTNMTCTGADAIMLRINAHEHLPDNIKVELVETVKESVPECEFYWDAND